LCVISSVESSGWATTRKSNSFLILAAALLLWKGIEIAAFSRATEHLHLEEASRGPDGLTRSKDEQQGLQNTRANQEAVGAAEAAYTDTVAQN